VIEETNATHHKIARATMIKVRGLRSSLQILQYLHRFADPLETGTILLRKSGAK
jgi:hypothetical protein